MLVPIIEEKKTIKHQYKAYAHIYSLNGEMDEITVLEESGNNEYLIDYRGVKCSAIFNTANFQYYADDVYGRKKE